jgi:hypothetical protein
VNIQSTSALHTPSIATTRTSNAKTKESALFSIETLLKPTSARHAKPTSSQGIGASSHVRQSSAVRQKDPVALQPVLASATPAASSSAPTILTTLANSNNPTAMWTPGAGFLNNSNPIGPVQNPMAQPFYITNSNYNPADPNSPAMIQDPTATAAPQAVQWTSSNGLTTTGVMNPFGLTQTNASLGFFGV